MSLISKCVVHGVSKDSIDYILDSAEHTVPPAFKAPVNIEYITCTEPSSIASSSSSSVPSSRIVFSEHKEATEAESNGLVTTRYNISFSRLP